MDNLELCDASNQGQVLSEQVHHNLDNIMANSSEVGHLWSSYLAENMSVCMLKYMVAKSKDPDIHYVLQLALDVSSKRVFSMENLFNAIKYPIPEGFGEKDVDVNASELFSETFSLAYTKLMNKFILINYSTAFGVSSRKDFRDFFSECIDTTQEVINKATNVLIAKGISEKAPNIDTPDRVEYVHDKDYYGNIFRAKRPLNAIEVGYIYESFYSKILIDTYILGLEQVVKSDKIKNYLMKGRNILTKHVQVLRSMLEKEYLPVPKNTNYLVSNSTESPFSDRLILFHITVVDAYKTSGLGIALTKIARKDVITTLSRFILEQLKYGKGGTDLLIEYGWLEKIPEAVDRSELLH